MHRLPNFCFIPADLNKEIRDKAPGEYLREYQARHDMPATFVAIMDSHLIPVNEDSPIWSNDYDAFLSARAELLIAKAKELAGVEQP